MANILAKFFGNYSKRELKRIQPLCDAVLALESKYEAMPEHELTRRFFDMLERSVRRDPSLYLWTHMPSRLSLKTKKNNTI